MLRFQYILNKITIKIKTVIALCSVAAWDGTQFMIHLVLYSGIFNFAAYPLGKEKSIEIGVEKKIKTIQTFLGHVNVPINVVSHYIYMYAWLR